MNQKRSSCVVYIITKLELGGAQKVCLSLLNGVRETGIPTFLISGAAGALSNQVKETAHAILLNEFKREVSLTSLFHELKTFISLIRHLKQLKRQYPHMIVHTHSTKAGLLGRWAAWYVGVKQRIHTVHGYAFHHHQNRIAWWTIYALELVTSFITTHYICVSSEDVKTGISLFPGFAKKHSIIRAAVNWQEFYTPAHKANPFPEHEPFIFGTVSCFKKQKNIFDLLTAFAQVYARNPRCRLEIIGDGVLRPALEAWIAHRQLGHVITLHGWQDTVAPLMAQWHTFVLSSLWEGLPCSIVEARLLKLPVLSYDTGGIHDVITPGENGFLYRQGDWQSLANDMLALTQQPSLYKKLQSAPDDLRDFNDKYMLKQHLRLYRSLLSTDHAH